MIACEKSEISQPYAFIVREGADKNNKRYNKIQNTIYFDLFSVVCKNHCADKDCLTSDTAAAKYILEEYPKVVTDCLA